MPNVKITSVNTITEVTEWLRQAAQCVDNAGVPEPYGKVAFAKAVDLLAAKRLEVEPTDMERLGIGLG